MTNIPYIVQTCDAGNHRRKDRPNGGMYISDGIVNLTIAAMPPQETLVVKKSRISHKRLAPSTTICYTNNQPQKGKTKWEQ